MWTPHECPYRRCQASLHFNSPDQEGEADIFVTAFKSCHGNQITLDNLKNHRIHSLDALHPAGVNSEPPCLIYMHLYTYTEVLCLHIPTYYF